VLPCEVQLGRVRLRRELLLRLGLGVADELASAGAHAHGNLLLDSFQRGVVRRFDGLLTLLPCAVVMLQLCAYLAVRVAFWRGENQRDEQGEPCASVLLERRLPCGVAFGAEGVRVVFGVQFRTPARLQLGEVLQASLQQLLAHGDALLLDARQREFASPAKRLGGRGRLDARQRTDLGSRHARVRRQRPIQRRFGGQREGLCRARYIYPHAHFSAALARRKQQGKAQQKAKGASAPALPTHREGVGADLYA